MKIKFSILLLIALLFFGCKKYPEDNYLINLRKPTKRLSHHSLWHISQYTVDGADSIPYINSVVWSGFPLNEVYFEFKNFSRKDWSVKIYVAETNLSYFKFSKNNKMVSIAFYPTNKGYTYPLFFYGYNDWEIRKLEDGIFIIELNKNGKNYRVKFQKNG